MVLNDIDLSILSRQEYIFLIGIIFNNFLFYYDYFTKEEKDIIEKILNNYLIGG